MRDSREPGSYPRRSPSGSTPNQSSRPRPRSDSTGQPRPPARRFGMAGADSAPRARAPLQHGDLPTGRPRLPSAEETREEQFERTERLRALRKDFLDHAQTKVQPQKPRNVWLALLLTGALLVLCIVGAVAFFELRPTLFAGGQTAATQFMDAMQQKNYTAAYANCTGDVQELFKDHAGPLSQDAFISQAQAADQVGKIKSYTLGNSTSIDSNHDQYTVTVTRNQQDPVSVILQVAKGSDGTWKISGIGSDLFPSPSPPSDTPTATPTSNLNLPDTAIVTRRRDNI